MLPTKFGFHSALIEPILGELAATAREVGHSDPQTRFITNLSGAEARSGEVGPEYWVRQAREPVRFADGVQRLLELGCRAFVEVGPGTTLLGLGRRIADDTGALWLPTLQRGRDEWEQVLHSLGSVYVRGAAVDWKSVHAGRNRKKLRLPTYPFQRQRYWIAGAARAPSAAAANQAEEPQISADPRDWLCVPRWDAAPLEGDRRAPLASSVALWAPVQSEFARLAADATLTYGGMLPRIDALCAAYIVAALEKLGWDFAPGETVDAALLSDRLGVAAPHRQLLARMLEILGEDGV